jgi:catechol 2,3-dioxygenase-like lactoylglutathione lyase family enzyme
MRVIGVADVARSVTFYRDVLGFRLGGEPGVTELVYGEARLQLGRYDYAPGEWVEPRPAGSSMLFFQTDDVEGMHEVFRQAGGKPTEIEKVNWIKMQLFEIQDPDGHRLWFGQSYDVPETPAPRHLLHKAMPSLPLSDVPAGVAHYRDVLGFQVNYAQHDIGVMDRDAVRVLLIQRTELHKGIGSAYVYVEDADALYTEFRVRGANVQGEPVSQIWGLREFRVLDPEGNEITFGQPFE